MHSAASVKARQAIRKEEEALQSQSLLANSGEPGSAQVPAIVEPTPDNPPYRACAEAAQTPKLAVSPKSSAVTDAEAHLIALVLNGLTSEHSRRSYRTGLIAFFTWIRASGSGPAFTKALVQQYRASLLAKGISSSTANVRLAPIRKLANEMADNQLLDPSIAASVVRVPGVKKRGCRAGNWLTKEQANDLLNAPSASTLTGQRDRAILAVLIGCGLRRSELLRIDAQDLQQREGRWVLPDLRGKGNRFRTVTVPMDVKARIDLWLTAAEITSGRLFRSVNRYGGVRSTGIKDEKVVWRLVLRYARQTRLGKLAPHDLRRTCAKFCRKAGGDLEQIQILLGHSSIQTTERYLGTEQALSRAVNDSLGLELH